MKANWGTRTILCGIGKITGGLSARYTVYREANELQRLRVDVPLLLTASIVGAVVLCLSGATVLAYEKLLVFPEHAREVADLKSQIADVTARLTEEEAKPKVQPAVAPPAPPSLSPDEIKAKRKVIDDALLLLNRVIKPAVAAARNSLDFSGPRGLKDTLEDREKWLRAYTDNLNQRWSGLWPTLVKARTFANNQEQRWTDIADVMMIAYPDYKQDFIRLFNASNLLLVPGKTQELNAIEAITEAARENCAAKLAMIERAINDATNKLVEIREATGE